MHLDCYRLKHTHAPHDDCFYKVYHNLLTPQETIFLHLDRLLQYSCQLWRTEMHLSFEMQERNIKEEEHYAHLVGKKTRAGSQTDQVSSKSHVSISK
jgi:hypothetical protein